MKYFLIIPIKCYWLFICVNKRKQCVFKESCSLNVYRITIEEGFIKGLVAFNKRFKTCRSGYKLTRNTTTNQFMLQLNNGELVNENDIDESLISRLKAQYMV